MLLVLKWIGFLFFAWTASRWIGQGSALHWIAPMAPIVVTGNAQPIVMLAALVSIEAVRRLKVGFTGRQVATALLVIFSITIAFKAGAREEMVRAFAGVACFCLFFGWRLDKPLLRACAAVLIASLIAFGWINRDRHIVDVGAFLPTYTWSDLKGSDADIARWARLHTPPNSLWVTPPDFESFRLIAERAIVADFKSLPFDDLAMREWKARMTALYGEVEYTGFWALRAMDKNYRKREPAGLRLTAARFGAHFAVLYAETPWPGRVLYENRHYKAVRLDDQ